MAIFNLGIFTLFSSNFQKKNIPIYVYSTRPIARYRNCFNNLQPPEYASYHTSEHNLEVTKKKSNESLQIFLSCPVDAIK